MAGDSDELRAVQDARAAPSGRAVGATLAVAGGAMLLALWPVIRSHGFGEHDAAFSAAQMGWLQRVMLSGGSLWDAPLGYPGGEGTTRADWVLVQAALTLPWHHAGPEVAWAAASLLGLAVTALGAAFATRRLLGDGPQLLPAILVLAVGPAAIAHLAHPNLLYTGIGLFAAGLAAGTRRQAFATGVLVAVAFHAGLYTGLRALALVAAVLAARRDAEAALAAALGFALLLPTLVPVYLHYAAAGGAQRVDATENQRNSVDVLRILAPIAGSPLHTALFGSHGQSSSPALPGYALSIVGLGGLWLRRHSAAWRLIGLGGVGCFVLALGSPLQFDGHPSGVSGPWILVDLLTQHRLRGPDRWLPYSHLALALGAGAALAALPARLRWPAALALTSVLILESPHPLRSAAPKWPAAVVEAAAAIPGSGPLWNIPRHDGCADAEYLVALTLERPLVGGSYARFDEALSAVNRLTRGWPSRQGWAWAREHAGLVVEHPPLRGDDPSGFRCVRAAGHRLCVPLDDVDAPGR